MKYKKYFDYVNIELVALKQPLKINPDTGKLLTPQEFIAYTARVSNPSNQMNTMTADKLLNYCIEKKHWSIFQMVSMCFEINTTRDIGRQMLRHHFDWQEFCVEENTKIHTIENGKLKLISIKDLYKLQNTKDHFVKIYNEDTKLFDVARIKEVFDTKIKPVYKLTLDNGKNITTTAFHKLFTLNGFKNVRDLNIDNDFVAINGVPSYQDKNWMEQAKIESINCGGGVNYIADKAEISYHTVRKWLRIHSLQFTKDEVATYTKIWNKNLPKELQPMFGKFHSKNTRNLMRNSSRKVETSNLYIDGRSYNKEFSWRKNVVNICKGYHTEILIKQNFVCPITNKIISKENSEIDHIIPVSLRPDLALSVDNLQIIHKDAHREKTNNEMKLKNTTPRYIKIKSIEYIGEIQTYDIEVDHINHNYVANGIVTHNSQRYANPTVDMDFVLREARLQDTKNRQNSIEIDENNPIVSDWYNMQIEIIDDATKKYKKALEMGVAKENARSVLPEGNTCTRMYMSGHLRSFIHYCEVREDISTQKEHRIIAEKIKAKLKEHFSFLD